MAYLTLLASVGEVEVDAVRADSSVHVNPSLLLGASHLLSNWAEILPMGRLLREAIDGGEVLNVEFWHPLRPPHFHRPSQVKLLAQQIESEWQVAKDIPQNDGGWLASEVARMMRLYQHASSTHECVITALEAPTDRKRAERVRIPWAVLKSEPQHTISWKKS